MDIDLLSCRLATLVSPLLDPVFLADLQPNRLAVQVVAAVFCSAGGSKSLPPITNCRRVPCLLSRRLR